MSLTIKAYLQKLTAGEQEIRRFSVPADVSNPESDIIAISSDEELLESLGYVEDSLLKIYIRENEASTSSNNSDRVHLRVICDGCEGPVVGIRYKCLTCPNYDLCSTCEQRGLHTEHNMMKISIPLTRPTGFRNAGRCMFAPPPHFHRWMHQLTECLLNRYNPTCYNQKEASCGQNETRKKKDDKTETPGFGEKGERETCMEGEEDPLTTFREGITAMLDLFGIDVSYDTEHHGRRSGCGNRGHRGRRGCHGRRRPCQSSCPRFGTKSDCSEKCRQQEADEEPKPSSSEERKDSTMNVDTEQSTYSSFMKEKNSKSSSEAGNGWTLLTKGREPPSSPKPNDQMTSDPEADPKIAEALQQMLAMGFNNYGGWLTSLLVSVNGNIDQALDAMKPQASDTRMT